MLENTLHTPAHLHEMGLTWTASTSLEHQQQLAMKTVDFVLLLAGHRAWSMFVYQMPPYTWAGILTDRVDHKTTGIMCAGSGSFTHV